MTPIGRRHAACVNRLTDRFSRTFRDAALVSVQNPLHLSEDTEAQPDLALLRPTADLYASDHPGPEDIFLLVDVAEASAETDRRVKAPLHARKGIQEVWPVDLEQETIAVYLDPSAGGYCTLRVVRRGEQLAPSAFPDRPAAAADIVPDGLAALNPVGTCSPR